MDTDVALMRMFILLMTSDGFHICLDVGIDVAIGIDVDICVALAMRMMFMLVLVLTLISLLISVQRF